MSAIQWFDSALLAIGRREIDLASDVLRLGLVAGAAMAEDDATPAWGSAGATNLASAQVATGASYAGPVTLTGVDWSIDEGRVALTADRMRIGPDRDGAQNVEAFVIFDDSHPDKLALAWGEVEHSLRDGALIIDLPLLLAMESMPKPVARRYPSLVNVPTESYPPPLDMAKPAKGVLMPWGDYETAITRLTDDGKLHGYATQPAFNADGTKVFLAGYPYRVVDLEGNQVGDLISGDDIDYMQLSFWDSVNPDLLWGAHDSGNSVCNFNIQTREFHSWPLGGEYTESIIGRGEGCISNDGRYIPVVCQGGGDAHIVIWDAQEQEVEGTLTLTGWEVPDDVDSALISQSGDYIILTSERAGNRGMRIYDRETLTYLRTYYGGGSLDGTNGRVGHSDLGYRSDGQECLFMQNDNGDIVTVLLSDASERVEIPTNRIAWNLHFSCRNIHRPGYGYVSMHSDSGNADEELYRFIFAVKLDGEQKIEMFGEAMFNETTNQYDWEAHACASPYGDLVVMGSVWGGTDPDTYIMGVPETMPEPPLTLAQLFGLAATRRIDLVMIGDSNQIQSGHGWDHGMQYALAQSYPMYATGLVCTGGSGVGVGYGYLKVADSLATSSAPADVGKYATGFSPISYGYLESSTYSGNNGLTVEASGAMDVNAALRAHYAYSTFDSGSGLFRPGVRMEQSPWTVLQMAASNIDTNTGASSLQIAEVDLAAATRDVNLGFKYTVPGQQAIAGPFAGHYIRIEEPGQTAGFSAHTAHFVGGSSLYDMAAAFIAVSDDSLTMFFGESRRLQVAAGQTPVVIVMVNAGLNDRNETSQPSLGPGEYTDADGADAFADNLAALVARIEGIWTDSGWSLSELHWLIVPSHPQSDPDDAELVAYRAAAAGWAAARQRAYVVDLHSLITSADILSNGWYNNSGSDKAHLTQAGYEGMASLIVP